MTSLLYAYNTLDENIQYVIGDMPMLIQIVTRMKEIRVAPIIATMNPSKAIELSIELSKQRSLD